MASGSLTLQEARATVSRWRTTKWLVRHGAEDAALYELAMNGNAALTRRILEADELLREGQPFGEPWRTVAREVAEGLMRSGWPERARDIMESAGSRIPPDFGAIAARLAAEGPRDGLIGGVMATPESVRAIVKDVEDVMAQASGSLVDGTLEDGRENRKGELRKIIPADVADDGWGF